MEPPGFTGTLGATALLAWGWLVEVEQADIPAGSPTARATPTATDAAFLAIALRARAAIAGLLAWRLPIGPALMGSVPVKSLLRDRVPVSVLIPPTSSLLQSPSTTLSRAS